MSTRFTFCSTRFSPRLKHKEILKQIDEVLVKHVVPALSKTHDAEYSVYLAESKFNLPENDPELIVRKNRLAIEEREYLRQISALHAIMSLYDYYGIDEFNSYHKVIDFRLEEMTKDM